MASKNSQQMTELYRNQERIFKICHSGKIDELENIFQEFGDIDAGSSFARDMLGHAAWGRNFSVLKFLIENKNFDVTIPDKVNCLVLHNACLGGSVAMVNYLINLEKFDVKARDAYNRTAVDYACMSGNLDLVKMLIEQHGITPDYQDKIGAIPLHYASTNNNLPLIRYLVEEQKQDPNHRDIGCTNAFSIACRNGASDVVKYFHEDLSMNITSKKNSSKYLSWTTLGNHVDIFNYLLENGASMVSKEHAKILREACLSGNVEFVKNLVEKHNCAINGVDKEGNSFLHCAAKSGNIDLVEYLIKRGLRPEYKNKNGANILLAACESGNLDLVKKLVYEYGMDAHSKDKHCHTALYYCSVGNLDMFKYFMENKFLIQYTMDKSSVNLTKNDAKEIISSACRQGEVEVVEYLFKNHREAIDVNFADQHLNTYLHHACISNQLFLVQLLLDNKANLEKKNDIGITPLHYACHNNNLDIVKALIQNGQGKLDIHQKDARSYSPWSLLFCGQNRVKGLEIYYQSKSNEEQVRLDDLKYLLNMASTDNSDLSQLAESAIGSLQDHIDDDFKKYDLSDKEQDKLAQIFKPQEENDQSILTQDFDLRMLPSGEGSDEENSRQDIDLSGEE